MFNWLESEETHGQAFASLYKKQAATREALRKWNKEVFGHCQVRINQIMQNITEIQKKPPSDGNGRLEEALQVELSEWLARTEVLWKQKSRELWLKEGDRSTKFFHMSTIIRRRRNHIDAIKSEDGQWITNPNQIRKLFFNSFKNLFSEEEVTFPSHLENLMPKSISKEDNVILKRIPSPEEIKEALFQMQDLKAPGPDGFPVLFYKEFWPIVGETVT